MVVVARKLVTKMRFFYLCIIVQIRYNEEGKGETNECCKRYRQFSAAERKKILIELCEFIEIAGIQKKNVINALSNENFEDLEDCLQLECAQTISADYIITRNIKDFATSSIPAISPEDFLQKMSAPEFN